MNGLHIVSWIVSTYFGASFIWNAGFPPSLIKASTELVFGLISLFFLFLPFFSKIKLGSWLELEREIKAARQETVAAKEELREFKNEVRNAISIVNTSTQHTNVYLPGAAELDEAKRNVAERSSASNSDVEKVEAELTAGSDVTLSLAKVRIDIERLLRQMLGARVEVGGDTSALARRRYMDIDSMMKTVIDMNPGLSYLRTPLRAVLPICNAAIHAQHVTEEQAQQALALGAEIIGALKDAASSNQLP